MGQSDNNTTKRGGCTMILILVRTADKSVWAFRKHEKKEF